MKPILTRPTRRRRRHLSFDPNSQYIADAVEEFLKDGGEITQLEAKKENGKQDSLLTIEDNKEADDFLKEA